MGCTKAEQFLRIFAKRSSGNKLPLSCGHHPTGLHESVISPSLPPSCLINGVSSTFQGSRAVQQLAGSSRQKKKKEPSSRGFCVFQKVASMIGSQHLPFPLFPSRHLSLKLYCTLTTRSVLTKATFVRKFFIINLDFLQD